MNSSKRYAFGRNIFLQKSCDSFVNFLQKSCDSFVNIKNSINFATQSTFNYG